MNGGPASPITDAERGLALAGRPAQRARALLAQNATGLQDAARNLGRVFAEFRKTGYRSGDWFTPDERTVTGLRVQAWQLEGPTAKVYGDLEPNIRFAKYFRDYEAVVPQVYNAGLIWALTTLDGQVYQLIELSRELAKEGFANWMHEASKQISTGIALCQEAAKTEYRATMGFPASESTYSDLEAIRAAGRCTLESTDSFIRLEKAAKAADDHEVAQKKYDYVSPWPQRAKYVELFHILRNQKRFPELIASYAHSATEGTRTTQQLITTAVDGIKEFRASLAAQPDHLWRYPVLVVGGVRQLKLQNIEGFQDYALEIARIKGASALQKLLNYVGLGLLVITLLSGVAGAVLIGLDLAVGGAGAYLAYARDRERELAANATSFLPDETKFAKDFGYGDTTLAVAFMLLASLSVVRGLKRPASPATAEGQLPSKLPPAKAPPPSPPTGPSASSKLDELPPRGVPPRPAKGSSEPPAAKAVGQEQQAVSHPKPPEGAVTAQKATPKTTTGSPKPAQRAKSGKSTPARAPEPPEIPIRETRRRALEKELETVKGRLAANSNFNAKIDKQIRQLNAKKMNAEKLGRTKEVQKLEEKLVELKDKKFDFPIGNPDSERYLEIQALLRGTERDYYKALTNAASRQQAFRATKDGPLHKMFKPLEDVASEVDHLYPRIEIWGRPGFDALTWNQQVFLFAWRKNLMRVPAGFNARRGALPYWSLKSDVWGEYIDDAWKSTGVDELARLEAAAAADIDAMIKNPKLIDAINDIPQLSEAISNTPQLFKTLTENPGLVDAIRKDPAAIDRILQPAVQ